MSDTRKNVKISDAVYSKVKLFCNTNALKISRWIELVLSERVNEEISKNMPEPE